MAVKKRTNGFKATGDSRAQTSKGGTSKQKMTEREQIAEFRFKFGWWFSVMAIAIGVGAFHSNYISQLFESDRHFSHLSNMEREMSFRTEMGLYYSYFKTIILAPSFADGINQITHDNVTEYPDTINTLKRFNLYPEVVLGYLYRVYNETAAAHNWRIRFCWKINRGAGKSPVPSCEGLGEPTYFYITAVMSLNGLMLAFYFLLATYVSGSILGGVITVCCYMFNHGESTRVMWTPPLRESFAFPFLILQMLNLVHLLKKPVLAYKDVICLSITTILFMLPWQFAQFALLTQIMAVFACYLLCYINRTRMTYILLSHTAALLTSFILLFGNAMLLTSFYSSALITMAIIVASHDFLLKLGNRVVILIVQGVMLLAGVVGVKAWTSFALNVQDDAHIGAILKSKFMDFKTFDTLLYTCAKEFDFLEFETYWKLTLTLLIPTVLVVTSVCVYMLLSREFNNWRNNESEGYIITDESESEKEDSEVVYVLLQMCAFVLMAVIIMRLKLFATPSLCLVASLTASRKWFSWLFEDIRKHRVAVIVLIGLMAIQGSMNIAFEKSIQGEYSNYPAEDLFEWIIANTSKNAVFAGPMPTMANVKLSTLRPIVNHPHYEDAKMRKRVRQVYSMASRKELSEVRAILKSLKVDYFVYEEGWCVRSGAKTGCTQPEIWDVEDPVNIGKTPVCIKILQKSEPYFKQVYYNERFNVFKVL